MTVTFGRDTPETVSLDLSRLENDFRGLRPLLERIVDRVFKPAIRERFDRAEWVPLSQQRLDRRAREGYSGSKPLTSRGGGHAMKQMMSAKARWVFEGGQGGGIFRAYIPESGNVPGNFFYRPLHNAGSDRHNVRFPARPFWYVTRQDEEAVEAEVRKYVDERVSRRGF